MKQEKLSKIVSRFLELRTNKAFCVPPIPNSPFDHRFPTIQQHDRQDVGENAAYFGAVKHH